MEERKLKRFNILLDDESLLYFPGSFLTGKVLLELADNTPSTGLYFHIIGEGVVRLCSQRSKKTLATDRENYIDFRMRLLGGDEQENKLTNNDNDRLNDNDQVDSSSSSSSSSAVSSWQASDSLRRARSKVMILSPGVHTFPFKLGLPANLPSTFLGLHGWVQYFCRAVLKEPSGLLHKNQQVFIIINPIDLNCEPVSLQQPFYCEVEERVSRNACSSPGSISCRVRLDRGAFVPGENILVSANIDNSSRLTIARTRAILTETVEYRAKSKLIQAETRELNCIERAKIAPKSSDNWKREPLHIPALPPTNLRGCNLIKINYDVYFQVFIKSNNRKPILKLQLPIVMATYPVRNKDGTMKRTKGASYPNNLPILRPWMDSSVLHS